MSGMWRRNQCISGAQSCRTLSSGGATGKAADLILVIASKGMYGGVYFSHINPKAKIIQINPKETEFDRVASVNIRMQADDVFKQISCFERQA